MAFKLEPGKYTIVHKESHKAIGTGKGSGPRPLVGIDVLTRDTVFSIERAGTEPFRRDAYRIKLEGASVTLSGDSVVVDADIPLSQASLWIIESKGEYGYGIIPGDLNRVVEPLAWTLSGTYPLTPISLQFVPQTKSIPPYSIFNQSQFFDLIRVD